MMTSYICLGHWPFRCLGLSPLSKKCKWGWSLLSHFLWFVHLCLITLPLPQYPPGESYLLHYWFVKQLKRLSPKGILVSPCVRNSMLQCCTTPRKGPGRRGDLAVLQSQKSNVHIALSPHDSPLSWFTIQTIIFLWSWWWKVESDVVDPR